MSQRAPPQQRHLQRERRGLSKSTVEASAFRMALASVIRPRVGGRVFRRPCSIRWLALRIKVTPRSPTWPLRRLGLVASRWVRALADALDLVDGGILPPASPPASGAPYWGAERRRRMVRERPPWLREGVGGIRCSPVRRSSVSAVASGGRKFVRRHVEDRRRISAGRLLRLLQELEDKSITLGP